MENSNDLLEIRNCFDNFIEAWMGKIELFDECIDEEPFIYFSMFDNCYNKDILKSYLSKRAALSNLDIKTINYDVLIKDDVAYMYATIVGVFTKNNYFQKHLAFGGTFSNQLVKNKNNWKLKTIRFDLNCEDSIGKTHLTKEGLLIRPSGYGQKNFISNWKFIDDRIGHNMSKEPNTAPLVISGEYDNPWYLVKKRDNCLDDKEQIKDLMYKYCFSFDYITFYLLKEVFDDDISFKIDKEQFKGIRDVIGYLKLYRKTMSRSFTSILFDKFEIEKDVAYVEATRISPDYKLLKEINDDVRQFSCGTYKYKAIKKDNDWKIVDFEFVEGE